MESPEEGNNLKLTSIMTSDDTTNEKKSLDNKTDVFDNVEIMKSSSLDDLEEDATSSEQGTGTFSSATLNLINTMIGAGMITFPSGFAKIGFIPALLIGFLFVAISSFSIHLTLVVAASLNTRKSSFSAACERYFPRGRTLVDVAVVIQCFGSAVSYLILIGQTMSVIMAELTVLTASSPFVSKYLWISIFLFTLLYPLSMLKTLAALRYASMVAVTMIFYITFMIVSFGSISAFERQAGTSSSSFFSQNPAVLARSDFAGAVSYLSCMLFAFVCHHNVFKVHNELRTKLRTVKTATKIATLATVFAGIIYFTVGAFGFLALGNSLITFKGGNLFSAFAYVGNDSELGFGAFLRGIDPHFISLLVARIGLVIMVSTCFPMQMHPCRDSLMTLLSRFFPNIAADNEKKVNAVESEIALETIKASATAEEQCSASKKGFCASISHRILYCNKTEFLYACTTLLCLLAYAISLFVNDANDVLAIVGASGCNIIGFLFPSIFYLNYSRTSDSFFSNPQWKKRLAAVFLALFGTFIMTAFLICFSIEKFS